MTNWSAPAPAPEPYHADPSPGGPPLVSPDGHWRWDGERWRLLDATDAPS